MKFYEMHNHEPDDQATGDLATNADAAAASATADSGKIDTSPFERGVEAAKDIPAGTIDDFTPKPVEKPAEPAATVEPQDPPKDPKEGEQPQDPPAAKDDDEKGRADAEAAAVAATEKEADELSLKGKARERFTAMSSRIRELETERTTREEVVLPELARRAKQAEEWENSIASTGAEPEQFARVMSYLYAANKGTIEQKKLAYAALNDELKWMAQQIGVKADGYNPLDEFPDLKAKVESGAMDEEDALAWAADRKAKAAAAAAPTAPAATHGNAPTPGLDALAQLGAELRARDGDRFKTNIALLAPALKLIQAKFPEEEWAEQARLAYEALPKPQAKPKPATPAPAPVRPGGGAAHMVEKPTVANAFEFGVQKAKATGR